MARILCVLILVLEVKGLSLSLSERKWRALVFYTQLSNVVTTVSALLLVLFGQPLWVTVLRYVGTCLLVMTFFVTTCVLIPMGGDPKHLLTGNGLFLHVLCPAVSAVSYIFFERHCGMVWLPAAVTLVYGLLMLYLNGIRKVDGPYPFFRVHDQTPARTVLWMAVLLTAVTGISAGVWALAR